MAKRTLQQRITINSFWWGSVVVLLVVVMDLVGWLRPLEMWLYDSRAANCQTFTPQPSNQIVYLDIDDNALDTIGRWPWRRSTMASILEEVQLAGPKVVGIDILYSEPQDDWIDKQGDQYIPHVEDPSLAEAMKKLNSVTLANSFTFISGTDQNRAVYDQAVSILRNQPSLKQSELYQRIIATSKDPAIQSRVQLLNYPDIRRHAIRIRINELIEQRITDLQEITNQLAIVPTTQSSDLKLIDTTLREIVATEYQHVLSERWIISKSVPPPSEMKMLPPDAKFEQLPIPLFCAAIDGSGFANYNLFPDPVVRSVPLFLRREGRLYPQFSFEATCKFLGGDLSRAILTDDTAVIPLAGGDQITIPIRHQYSTTVGRDVGSIIDIPWFGTKQWETMHDWPEYKNFLQHYNIQVAWSITEARKRLANNNLKIDPPIKFFSTTMLVDADEAAKYATEKRSDDDFSSRKLMGQKIIQAMKDADLFDLLSSEKRAELKNPDDIVLANNFVALYNAIEQNLALEIEIQQRRRELSIQLKNKLVFIGSTATATGDFVSTSLHTRCPGVVVHGVIANAMINRDFLTSASNWVTVLISIVLGLSVTWITASFPPMRTFLMTGLIALAYLIVNGYLFYDRWNWVVKAAAPLSTIGACWTACMIVRLILESVERIRMKRESAIIEHEISLAQQVQAALIPKELAIISSVDSHGWTLAATTTGGDCFDLWRLADGRLGILVGDASGHGLGPSIVVSQVRALVRALCDLYKEPQNLLERINQRMTEDLEGKKFCTTFVGFLATDGTLSWGSAGHGPMLWAESLDAEPQEIGGTAMPLGVSIDYFGDESVPPIKLGTGGWLAVVSDGIFEASRPDGEQYGVERIKDVIKKTIHTDCANIIDAMRKDVLEFQAKPTPDDDQTIVFIKVKDIFPVGTEPPSDEGSAPDTQPSEPVASADE